MAPRGITFPKCYRGTGVRRVKGKRSYFAFNRRGCNGVWGVQDVVRVPRLTKREHARRKHLQNQIATAMADNLRATLCLTATPSAPASGGLPLRLTG